MLFAAGCSTIVLKPADFSWPVESVLTTNEHGMITEERHSFDINVKSVFYEEFNDSTSVAGKEIRVIRDKDGRYYFTGSGFKNIYLFMPIKSGMKLEDKINISDSTKLQAPVFNQKTNHIELIDGQMKYSIIGNEIVRIK